MYESLVDTLHGFGNFETLEDITEFETIWKDAIVVLDENIEILTRYAPDKTYEEIWDNLLEYSLQLRELCTSFTNLDPNKDGKYTSEEGTIYNTFVPKIKKAVNSIIESHRAFNEIELEINIAKLIGSNYVWISDGGFENPYDRFLFDFENMKFIWDFKSSQANYRKEYEMALIDEHTIEVSGVRDDEVPARIYVVDINKLQVVYLEDIIFNGDILVMSDCYLLRTTESADNYINSYEDKHKDNNSTNIHQCIECGKYAFRTYTNPFSGEKEPYCETHYQKIIDIMSMMEEDVGKSSQSKHTCEQCSREGTHRHNSFTGQTEYYCTQHYEELKDMLEEFGIE